MAGLFNIPWLDFSSREEREKRNELFRQRMYRFGEMQQEWEKDMIARLFPEKKKSEHPSLRFFLITRREAIENSLLPADDENYVSFSEGLAKWERDVRYCRLNDDETARLAAMADLEEKAAAPDSLPTLEQIIEKAKTC